MLRGQAVLRGPPQMTAATFDALDRPPHLLLVDDDDRIRELLKRYLTQAGARVSAAGDAAGARKLLGSMDFDLLILDVMMPVEDGFSLAESVRKNSKVPIVLLTARGMPEDRIRGLADRRRRLCRQAVRAGGTRAAHQRDPAPLGERTRRDAGSGDVRAVRVQRRARRTFARRRAGAADGSGSGDAAHPWRRGRAKW